MKRNVFKTIAAVVLAGFAAASFASPDAQLELQPKRLEFGWFKRPVEATSYQTPASSSGVVRQDYRYLTDYSPN